MRPRAGPSTAPARSCAPGSSTSTRTTTPSCCGTRPPARRRCTASPPFSAATAASRSRRSARAAVGAGHTPSTSTHEELLALSATLRDHEGTTLEFIPAIGPIPQDRVELMADMSLAAGRTLNWNLLGSLSPVEIYEEQLKASDVAAAKGARVVALTLPDLMRLRAGTVLPNLPGWNEVLERDATGRRAAAAEPDTRA